jgi:glyoxylase-like metal-dependent hydrolase (beta-lactamase superfamily II)
LHNRNLQTIYITNGHFDHFYGLSVLLDRFPGRSGNSNAEDGGGHAVVICSSAEPIRPPIVSWTKVSPDTLVHCFAFPRQA